MKWDKFQTRAKGKWVLAGEHSVLRGASAVALPHPEYFLDLRFEPEEGCPLRVTPESASAVVCDILLGVRDSLDWKDLKFQMPEGRLTITSSIPIGAGLGSSAALCVAMSRWFSEPLGLQKTQSIFEFATQLEHRFHGRSSGMDVAVIDADEPISFSMPESTVGLESSRKGTLQGITPLGIKRIPRFTFHDTEIRARTSDCVLKVGQLFQSDPDQASRLDEAMGAACRLAAEGLIHYDRTLEPKALELIARAMREAQKCYESWGLVPEAARTLEKRLLSEGALAVKMTGAGGGGMLVALWPESSPP